MLHPSFAIFLPQIRELFKKNKIRNACVFGSVLTPDFNTQSDVDFVLNMEAGIDPVKAGEYYWDLYYDLKKLLNREVDLVSERSLKNPYFIEEINRTKIPIYGY